MDMKILTQTLENVQQKLKKYNHIYENNMEAVRLQIVSPVLNALGWDTTNPKEVLPTERGYVLIKNENKVLMVEIDKNMTSLSLSNTLDFANQNQGSERKRSALITNGIEWKLINNKGFTQWEINLMKNNVNEIIPKMLSLYKENIDIFYKQQKEKTLYMS